MNKVFVINGIGGSGKDTFVEMVTSILGQTHVLNVSTVDKVKEVARSLGWMGKKEKEDRKALSDLKDMMTYWNDAPFKDVCKKINFQNYEWDEYGIKDTICFIHCREPNEIQRLVDELGAQTLLVRRPLTTEFTNHADLEVENYQYDYVIENNRTLDDLRLEAIKFIEMLKAED